VITPPVDIVRDALGRVASGAFSGDPDAAVQDLDPQRVAALVWAITEGLIDEREIALTEKGRRFYMIIGGPS